MSIFILGVTGVIGSGKSTLCRYLQKRYGFYWIEADKIVHENLYQPGHSGYQKIQECFGEKFVGTKGVLRGRLRRFVLKTPQKLWILNQLIHPLVVNEVNKKIVQIKKATKGREVKIALEAMYFTPQDLGKLIDKLIVVDASDEIIIKRFKKTAARRKIPLSQLKTLLKFQRENLRRLEKIMRPQVIQR